MQITIYSTTTCPYCKALKDYLTSKSIVFTEKLVDMDENAQKEMSGISGGFLGVPFTLIVKDDGTKETVMGFDKGKIDTILQISTNKPISTNVQ
jgi:glutaredoxin